MNILIKIAFPTALILGGAAYADEPARNVSGLRHPNLAAAQDLIQRAYDRLTAAQNANEFDMGGHATHAKQLLSQAADEIRQAATQANRH